MGIISNKKVSVAILYRSNHRLTDLYIKVHADIL